MRTTVTQILARTTAEALHAPQADTDQQFVSLWLHGRSPNTQRAYRADIGRFLAVVATPLPTVTLGDLQAFADTLEQLPLCHRHLAALFSVRTTRSGSRAAVR